MSPFCPLASRIFWNQHVPLSEVGDSGAVLVFRVGNYLVGVLKLLQEMVDILPFALEPVGEGERVHVVAEILDGNALSFGNKRLVEKIDREDDDCCRK